MKVHNQINSEVEYKDIINRLVCTRKGRALLNKNRDSLTKKERQFLLLLDGTDEISKKICVSIAPKIRLRQMLDAELIASITGNSAFLTDLDRLNAKEMSKTKNAQSLNNNTQTLPIRQPNHQKKILIDGIKKPTKTGIEKANELLAKSLEKTKGNITKAEIKYVEKVVNSVKSKDQSPPIRLNDQQDTDINKDSTGKVPPYIQVAAGLFVA